MKPERIEVGLRGLAEWQRDGAQGICRSYVLPNWREALILVDFSQATGARMGRYPRTEVCAGRVVIRLPPAGARQLQDKDFEVARILAAAEVEAQAATSHPVSPNGKKL